VSALPSLVEGSSDPRLAALDAAGRGWPVIPLYGVLERAFSTHDAAELRVKAYRSPRPL
jgi:hypothetical protein